MFQFGRLVDDVRVNITTDQKRRLNIIDDEDYIPVIRKVREEHPELLTEELERGVHGLKQYYTLPVLDPKNSHTVSSFVDPFWHAHILHAHQYAGFCHRVFGTPLCHVPLNRQDKEQMDNIAVVYDYTIETLTKIFGGRPDISVWAEGNEDTYICWGSGTKRPKEIEQEALFPASERGVCVIARRLVAKYAYAF